MHLPPEEAPSARTARNVVEQLGVGFEELHVLVADESQRSHAGGVVVHRTRTYRSARYFRQIDAAGLQLYATSPELTFLQIAATSGLLAAIAAGNALCSDYRYDTTALGGVIYRADAGEMSWTTPKRLRSFVGRHVGERGYRCALMALDYVYEGARSPKESGIALSCGLPYRLGGYALGDIKMNPHLSIFVGLDDYGQRKYQERIPDVVVTAKGADGILRATGIDYDAWSTHGSPERVTADILRKNQIATVESLTHIVLTTAQVRNYHLFELSMDEIRRTLHVRKGPRIGRAVSDEERRIKDCQAERLHYDLWDKTMRSSELFGATSSVGR